jgi:nitrile hydratase accessory protein
MSAADHQFAGAAGLPRDDEGPVFAEPWEAQAFALAVALHDAKVFSWVEWTNALAREIAAPRPDDERSYYRYWLAALERLTVEKGAASLSALDARKKAWARAEEATPHGQPILLANDPERSSDQPDAQSRREPA